MDGSVAVEGKNEILAWEFKHYNLKKSRGDQSVKHKMQFFHLLSPLYCTGIGSCWVCWQPLSQLGPALLNLARPAPSGDTARHQKLRTLLLADIQGQSLPGCLS